MGTEFSWLYEGHLDEWIGNNCVAGDSAVEPYKVTHYQLLAHAAVVKLYRTKYQELQKGKIGLTVNSFWFVPYDETEENYKAKDRALDFMLGWIMDPITFGKYPESMRERVGARLPEFTKEESDMVRGSIDFLGANYYSNNYARNIPRPTHVSYLTDSGAEFTGLKNGIPIGKQGSTHSWYYAYPKGLREVLRYLKEKYNNPLIYITENGLDLDRNDSIPVSEALQDYERKDYFLDHLCCLREALELDGANVKGFFAWSLTDNYEWISGIWSGLGFTTLISKIILSSDTLNILHCGSKIFSREELENLHQEELLINKMRNAYSTCILLKVVLKCS